MSANVESISAVDAPSDIEIAKKLGVSIDAVQLVRSSEVIDLHIDTFIPSRMWGYDIMTEHKGGPFWGRFFGHLDIPRAQFGGLTGGMWSITTNPLRPAGNRWGVLQQNIRRLELLIRSTGGKMQLVRNLSEYKMARQAGALSCMMVIQGGNALEAAPQGVNSLPKDTILRVTLVHLTNSVFGTTSSPGSILRRFRGLTERGKELVSQLNANRILVDLAHIHPDGFWDAVSIHDRTQPLIVTHTGVSGVKEHWRNLDDAQIKAIAETGGTIGIMFHAGFLRPSGRPNHGQLVIDHMEQVIRVVGEDFVSIGSDYDGAIIPPPDLRSATSYPRLVQYMMDRGWGEGRIRKILGENFLRVLKGIRG